MSTAPRPIPSLPGSLVVGNLRAFRQDRIALFQRVYRELGEMGKVRLLHRTFIVGTSPELNQAVLVKQQRSFMKFAALAEYARPTIGNGILSSEGDVHRRQRKLIAPGLSYSRITQYVASMARHTDEAIDRWEASGRIDVVPDMLRLTMGIASEAMFGAAVERYAEVAGIAVRETTEYMATSLARPWVPPFWWPTPRNRRLRRAIAPLDAIVRDMIQKRRESSDRPRDILSMLLDAQDEGEASGSGGMTDEQVRDEVMTLFVAGHETTSNAFSWCAWLLSNHPDIADRLADEARPVLGGRPPAVADLERLPYAKQVFLEAMRLYPPAYIVGREAVEDVEVAGWRIPKGATLVLNIFGMHRRADFFPDPDRFDPDRFEGDKEKSLPRGVYIPFGDGPRVCVGAHFTVVEAQVLLAHLAQRLRLGRWEGAPVTPVPRVTLRPSCAFTLPVTPR